MSGDLMTQTEAADELGLSRATVRKWTAAGILPHVVDPDGGWTRYSRRALAAWADQLGRNAANGAA